VKTVSKKQSRKVENLAQKKSTSKVGAKEKVTAEEIRAIKKKPRARHSGSYL
jgi:hypothetical protein